MTKVLIVVSEKGFSWDEVVLPYIEFVKAKCQIQVTTPTGKEPVADPLSIQIRPILNLFGAGTALAVSPQSKVGQELNKLLAKPLSLTQAKAADYDLLYVAGGHGALFDLNKNSHLHQLILQFDSHRKPLGLICHATSTLAFIKQDSHSFLKGRNITGFPTTWERFILAVGFIDPRFLPLPIWTGRELDTHATGRSWLTRVLEVLNPYFVVEDKNLVTGVGPKAGGKVAQKMLSLISDD